MDDLGRLTGELVSGSGTSALVSNANAGAENNEKDEGGGGEEMWTLLKRMEMARGRLEALGLGMRWMGVLERVMLCA